MLNFLVAANNVNSAKCQWLNTGEDWQEVYTSAFFFFNLSSITCLWLDCILCLFALVVNICKMFKAVKAMTGEIYVTVLCVKAIIIIRIVHCQVSWLNLSNLNL